MNLDKTNLAIAIKSSEASTIKTKSTKTSGSKFKDELEESTKVQDSTKSAASESKDKVDSAKAADAKENSKKTEEAQKASETQKKSEEQNVLKENELSNETQSTLKNEAVKELNEKIAKLNEIKTGFGKTNSVKNSSKLNEANDVKQTGFCQTMKMNNQDMTFFLNLVGNQEMTAQTGQSVGLNSNKIFTDIKAEATQSSVKVSQTLLDALNKSSQTGKPFRIDFDKDIAVIMKVDKQGVLSANFIPGNSAVENYLRNNIQMLKQSFEEQNLPYNELSYSQQQKREQQGQNKEKNSDE